MRTEHEDQWKCKNLTDVAWTKYQVENLNDKWICAEYINKIATV